MKTIHKNTYCVILAGGVGSRFWPMSTSKLPKQFHDVLGIGRTLIQQTYDRLLKICLPEQIYVITGASYKSLVKEQLPELNDSQIMVESVGKNTAPCAVYSAFKIKQVNPEAQILTCPSDHLILDIDTFVKEATQVLEASAQNSGLYTLGIQPTRPDTGYGYIQYIENDDLIKKVKTFTEKPSLEIAQKFLESGNFLWNSGIFIWSAQSILEAFEEFLPEMYQDFKALESIYNTPQEEEKIGELYPTIQNISIDYGIMEKNKTVYVLPSHFSWTDLGTWLSLYENSDTDEHKNVINSKNLNIYKSKGNMIYSNTNKAIVIDELENYIVVDTPEALLITPLKNSQEIRTYVHDLKLTKKERFT